jgi:hypothetical protein
VAVVFIKFQQYSLTAIILLKDITLVLFTGITLGLFYPTKIKRNKVFLKKLKSTT